MATIALFVLANAPPQLRDAQRQDHPIASKQISSPPQQQSSDDHQERSSCPGTNQPYLPCDAVAAAADERQAASADDQTTVGWLNFGGNVITALVALAAAMFAWQAADAAQKNLVHDKVTAAAQLRPWISYHSFEVVSFTNALFPGGERVPRGLMGNVSFINTGVSPALDVRLYGEHVLCGLNDHAPPPFPEPAEESESAGALGPQRLVTGPDFTIGPEDTDDIMARRKCFWLHTRVDYEEPGQKDNRHSTEITVKVWYKGEGTDRSGNKTPLWWARAFGAQNTMT